MNTTPIRRALLSVSDKTNITTFAKQLTSLGIEIISTGGTSQALQEAGIAHRQVDDVTRLPAMLDGRVKTLHPAIHSGILGRRDIHAEEVAQHKFEWIDLVVVNFYPFAQSVNSDMPWQEAVEYIDVGGPTMVRAAAKNFAWVGVITDPQDYDKVLQELHDIDGLSGQLRQQLAEKAFAMTSHYDAMIHQYFISKNEQSVAYPDVLNLHLQKNMELRYGENPHQKACAYQFAHEKSGVFAAKLHQGKPLSYNNLLDAEAAWACVQEFEQPACVITKHANPCGVATSEDIDAAWDNAFKADPVSAFGGIVALNRPCTATIAAAVTNIFMEVMLAPAYTEKALEILAIKPNMRLLVMPQPKLPEWEYKFITGGVLMQQKDYQLITAQDLQCVTRAQPDADAIEAMLFAWHVIKHVKSNAILIASKHATIGIGAGQVSRIDSVDIALRKAGENARGAVLASDAFFPFRDGIDRLADTGISAIIQPGGSVRDEEVIAACDEHNIAMVFTGKRCFRH